MRQAISFVNLLGFDKPLRGVSDPHPITADHQRAFSESIRLGDAPAAPPEPEIEPFHLLALVRRLLPDAFVIDGAKAQELVYLEKVRFVRPVEAGQKVQLAAVFLEALPDDDGLVAVRLGVSLHTVDEEIPVLVGEVSLLCGNPE